MMKETAKIPAKLHRKTVGTSSSQYLTSRKSRPTSANTRQGGAGQSRPQSAPLQRRPQAVSSTLGTGIPAGDQQWDPFRGLVGGAAAVPPTDSCSGGASKTSSSVETLKKIGDVFHNCLEDLDIVERDNIAEANMALKRRFAMLKIQVADLSKQIDLIREDLAR